MNTEHKGIEPIGYLEDGELTVWYGLSGLGFRGKVYPQSAIDTLQAEKVALADDLAALRLFQENVEATHKQTLRDLQRDIAALDKQRDELLAALQWQPIETAPKDGTRILGRNVELGARETCWNLYGEGSPAKAQFDRGERKEDGCWNWSEPRNNWGSYWEPTHWMPLPAAPAIANAKGAAA